MVKTAIFVEGQTELIFVREFLLRYFEWQDVSLECFCLVAQGNMDSVPFDYPNPNAGFHFQIINVGGDSSVLRNMLKWEKYMWNSGFHSIVGLRDMYSEDYKSIVKSNKIDPDVNRQFIEGHRAQIDTKAQYPEKVFFNFAIMEAEAWFLGLSHVFEKLDAALTNQLIEEKLDFNLEETDPETTFFHPAVTLGNILRLVGRDYKKKEGDIEMLISNLQKTDYQLLLEAEKCDSFNQFFDNIPTESPD